MPADDRVSGVRATILVPSFNHARWVVETVRSALAQTERDVEVVVIDDGSTDDSVSRLATIADPRLEVVTQPNAGLSNTLNRGLARARGRWVKFVPSDDVLEPDCIARQLAAAERAPGARLVFALPTVVDADGAPYPDPAPQAWFDHAPEGRDEILRDLLERNFLCAPAVLFDRDLARVNGGFDPALRIAQDYDLWLRLAERHPMANLPEVLYHYRAAMGRRHTEQAATAARVMLRAWTRLRAPEPSEHGVIAGLVARATWGGRGARSAQAELESHLAQRGPTREGLLAWQWIAGKAGRLGDPRLMRLRECGRRMRAAGVRRAFLYGAGRHTSWLLDNAD